MIFLDISFELKKKAGIGAYILTLMKALELLNKPVQTCEFKINDKIKFKNIWYLIWLNTYFLVYTFIKKPEVIIYPSFFMPYFTRKKTKYITVIHDLCADRQGEMTKYFSAVFRLGTYIAVKKADVIITVSQTIKEELIKKYNLNPDRLQVVHNSVAEHFMETHENPDILKKYGAEKNKYLLSVATLNKRKNIPELIKAFESISDKYPDLKLILVGGMGNEQREKLTTHPNIVFTGYIQDEDIPELYKNALFYVYPSVYEGFGIPQIEAQYCGCPVLCSDIDVFREISAESAEYCEPVADDIAKKIEYLITHSERLKELREKGFHNIKRFSFEQISKQLEKVLN